MRWHQGKEEKDNAETGCARRGTDHREHDQLGSLCPGRERATSLGILPCSSKATAFGSVAPGVDLRLLVAVRPAGRGRAAAARGDRGGAEFSGASARGCRATGDALLGR